MKKTPRRHGLSDIADGLSFRSVARTSQGVTLLPVLLFINVPAPLVAQGRLHRRLQGQPDDKQETYQDA